MLKIYMYIVFYYPDYTHNNIMIFLNTIMLSIAFGLEYIYLQLSLKFINNFIYFIHI